MKYRQYISPETREAELSCEGFLCVSIQQVGIVLEVEELDSCPEEILAI